MNKSQEKLVAQYLAGEDVAAQLIIACKQSPKLLIELSNDAAFSRILAFRHNAQSDEEFIRRCSIRLASNKNDGDTPKDDNTCVRRFFNKRLLPYILLLIIFISTLIPVFYNTTVGIVNKAIAAQSNETEIIVNDNVKTGKFFLSKGYAELTLANGVKLLLEAPIKLHIKSVNHITLQHGRLVARVPTQATDFMIDTPSAQIIDLASELAINVDVTGESQVHVLKGEVKAKAINQSFEHLIADQARLFDVHQQVVVIKNNPQLFMRTLPDKVNGTPSYLHWRFNQQEGNVFPCEGQGINHRCYDAMWKISNSLEGIDEPTTPLSLRPTPNFVAGKFGEGVYFNGVNTWLETDFAGIGGNKPRTVSFWLQVPKDFKPNQAFGILSWGLSQKLSAWQISPNPNETLGPLSSLRIGTNHGVVIGTTPLNDGQWHHIAIVLYGGESANLATHILFYLDGELEKTSRKSIAQVFTKLDHPKSKPLVMGRNIAYPGRVNNPYSGKFFRGGIDELYIFDTAISHQQVKYLMLHNRLLMQ